MDRSTGGEMRGLDLEQWHLRRENCSVGRFVFYVVVWFWLAAVRSIELEFG